MAERIVYLVRHAPVTLDAERPAPEWRLSAEGERAVAELARRPDWRSLALIASSPEPKALDTARPIALAAGLELRIEPDLREVERGATPVVGADEYERMVEAHFAAPGKSVNGWERGAEARARVTACVERLVREAGGTICVVSHGLLLSHLVAHLRGLPAPDVADWRAIPLPAVAVVRNGRPTRFG